MKTLMMTAGALLIATGASAAVELLPDPGIEKGATEPGTTSPWGTFGAVGVNAFFGDNGHLSFFPDQAGNSGGAFQAGINGAAGIEYTFTLVDVRIESNFNTDMRFGLEFYAADDTTKLGEILSVIDTAADRTPLGEVNGASFQMSGTAVAGTVFVRPVILFENADPLGQGQGNLFVFEASLIPTPSTGLLGLAAFGLVSRRRR